MSKTFKPMLCPNEKIDLDTIKYPVYASYKLDGIRCVFHPELGMVSRALKIIPNKQLQEKFKHLTVLSKLTGLVLDGELYSHKRTFQEITRACMTDDLYDEDTQKKLSKDPMIDAPVKYVVELVQDIEFHCFDQLDITKIDQSFEHRCVNSMKDIPHTQMVEQILLFSREQLQDYFNRALNEGYEGLILKDPTAKYKFGRGTVKEGVCYKVKPYIDKSATITGIVQATVVDPNAEKKINELGNSVTSKKKDDRILIEKAAAFIVDYAGQDLKVVIAASDVEKEEIWNERDQYIGKEVCYKSMEVGMKEGGLPRHPVATRWWKKDE